MTVLIDRTTSVLIQGITGTQGRYHTARMLEYNVRLLAGVTPGKGGQAVEGVPVYNTVREAVAAHPGLDASLVVVAPRFVLDCVREALEAGIRLVVIVTEFVPVHDSLRIVRLARERGARVVGPNTIGVIAPGVTKVGIMPGYIYSRGRIGVISRSGTLTHEMASNLTFAGYGQSTCIGIGGDPVIGISHREALELFRDDPDTEVVLLIGEIGGVGEEVAADYLSEQGYPKPVLAYIAGRTAPAGKQMGHAGAIIAGEMGSAAAKVARLEQAGVRVALTPGQVVEMVAELDGGSGRLRIGNGEQL